MNPLSVTDICAMLNARSVGVPADQCFELEHLCFDSRACQAGSIFVAIRGASGDGNSFIAAAFQAGAACAVVEDEKSLEGRPGFIVSDTRLALSRLAAESVGNPSIEMLTVGITGTNGKTTINWLLYHVFEQLGIPSIRLGTLGVCAPNFIRAGSLTTPDPLQLQRDLRKALDAGAKACVIETSSHGLDQKRIEDLAFDVGVFTNLTRDHLDYHPNMEAYFDAKAHLFELLAHGSKTTKGAVINLDSEAGVRLRSKVLPWGLNDFSFGHAEQATVRIRKFTQNLGGSVLELQLDGRIYVVETGLIGEHSGQNIAAVFAVAAAFDLDVGAVASALAESPQVPGRLESVGSRRLGVFVDYAHSPDALENVLKALRPITKGKLWVVFGCGGDRDKGKRPQMAAIASKLADRVVVTSDNPRTEDPQAIINDILSEGCEPTLSEVDREKAIGWALRSASDGDLVLIAGKGHEDYQVIGKRKIHFSDQEVAKEVLSELGHS